MTLHILIHLRWCSRRVNMTTKSVYYESLQGDVRKRYDEKMSLVNGDPYMMAKGEFSKDRGEWPEVTTMDVIQFLVYKDSAYSKDQLKNYKSLDAYKLFQDGWVQEILHKKINGLHLFRAKVHHSMRIREKPLDPWVIINADGSIEAAHCTCMAGLGECCSHVGAVLFALETFNRIRQEATVTDVAAYWKYPSSAKFDQPFKRIREMDFQSASKKRCMEDMKDVRSAPPTPGNIPSPTKREQEIFFRKLYEVLPNSGILSLTKEFAHKFKPKAASVNWPKEFGMFLEKKMLDCTSLEEVVKKCKDIDISLTDEEIVFVEKETRKQTGCDQWYEQRKGRVTASVFHAVCHAKTDKPPMSLLKKITAGTKAFFSAATEWGRKNESKAIGAYKAHTAVEHSNFSVNKNGLYLSKKHPQLAASPDSMVKCDCCGVGCLEVKCPWTMRREAKIMVPWMVASGTERNLSRDHPYFFQVQLQMYVTGANYCDFVIWCPNDLFIERIVKDEEFLEKNIEKALIFHRDIIMPELVCRFFSRKAALCDRVVAALPASSTNAQPPQANSTDEETYCTCKGIDDGRRMIMCEGKNCQIVWYHMSCVKIKRAPRGSWFCKACKAACHRS